MLAKSSLLTDLLQYLAKNMALLVQKLWVGNKLSNPFSAVLRQKKVPTAIKLGTTINI